MKFLAKKSIAVIVVAVLILAGGLGALSVSHNAKSMKQFVADGFILDAPADVAVTEVNQQHYFSQGAKYQKKYDTKVLFKDASGEDVSVDINQFLHYADGSLGSFTKGVIMNLDDVDEEQFGYYSITSNTLLLKNGTNYEMSSRGEKMVISEFVWKISDTDYMIVSPEVTLKLSAAQEITLPDYAQIKYVDSGIVRIIHQQGTYQTVSADSFLYTKGGQELNLVGKSFFQNGEAGLSLDSMAIDDEGYIELDENVDSPELKIPTFNVINGKDGAAGSTGEAGEVGEDGAEGEEGEEGDTGDAGAEGAEGMAGSEGIAGSRGNRGSDGVEGDEGLLGYDGRDGEEGEDAVNANDSIVATDLFARPTISMDASDSYEVTSGSASMQLNLNDRDQALVGNGTTSVEIYDRATMQRVNTDADATSLGAQLENTGSLSFTQSGLNPDTEYVVMVKGQYVTAEGLPAMEAVLYSKVFRTDSLGVVLYKEGVTDNSVSVRSEVTASNISNYMVHFFVYEETVGANGETERVKKTLAYYDGLTASTVCVLDKDNPVPGVSRPIGEFEPASNTIYYAEIANVLVDGQVMNVGDTVVELRTLKKKPYHREMVTETDPVTGLPVEVEQRTPITAMQPTVTLNAKNHSVIVSMASVNDDDNGVKGWRYELYRQSEIDNAAMDGTLANLAPAYTKTVQTIADQTFIIPEGDNATFVARVVAEFNDNEKDVEYATLFSNGVQMSAAATSLLVEFVDVAAFADGVDGKPDSIRGYIKITDTAGVLYPNISNSHQMILTMMGEYDDVITIPFKDQVAPEAGTTNVYLYAFEQTGLHKDAMYTLSVSGPWDTNDDDLIEGAEASTYLAGCRARTSNTSGLSMAFRPINNMATVAFAQSFYLTAPADAGTGNNPEVGFYQYEADIMNSIEFELIHVLDNGVEVKMGDNAVVMDSNLAIRDSVFFDSCWVERNATNIITNADGTLSATDAVGSHDLVLTPASFGLDNNDSRFFSGGKFKIRAVAGKDYTQHANEIPFVAGEDVVVFEISKRHVQATDPNVQVAASFITNNGARDGFVEDGKADDTVVGLRFRAEYPYTDVQSITYYIYELSDSDPATDALAGQLFYEGAGNHPGNLVLTGTQTIGQSAQYYAPEVELYFNGTRDYNASSIPTIWKDAGGNDITGLNQTVLERGKRYYIRYEVTANKDMIDCGNDGQDDRYPQCAYNVGDPIPFYRSPIVEVAKQTPQVLRYPHTSGADSATWMYRVIDPDGAVEGGFMVKTGATAEACASAVASPASSDVSAYLADYSGLTINGLIDGQYYAVSLNYKMSSTAATQSITSAPVLFESALSTTPDGIRAQGVGKTANTPPENVSADGVHEKAMINEGGYRYKLTLQGADIKQYAAYKVTLTNVNPSGEKVVFDPVYPDYIGELTGGEYYATLYMDAAPIMSLVNAGVTQVNVSVDGYYNTHINGMDGFVSGSITDKSFDNEKLFALKLYQEDGTTLYRRLSNGAWVSMADAMSGSVIVPGGADGENGFVLDGEKKTATMTMRYAVAPMSVSDAALVSGLNESLMINENGLRVTSMANTAYYTVEKLGKKEQIVFSESTDQTMTIGQVLPAVEKVEIVPGATSAYLKFRALGVGATADSKIYAKVYSPTELMKLERRTEGTGVDAVTYYQVLGSGTESDYAQGSIAEIPITAGENVFAELKIRGLEKNTDYRVVLYAYDAHGDIVYLYSLDGRKTGYEYLFKTLSDIKIDVAGPTYSYVEYADKSAVFGFGIPGDEGTGKKIYYTVYQGAVGGPAVVSNAYVEPLNSGGYIYYSQLPNKNNPIVIGMNPGAGLRLNTTYVLQVRAVSSANESEVLGTKEVTFTTPASLADPTFNISATSRKQDELSNLVTVNATIASTDEQRSIINNKYLVELVNKETGVTVTSQEVTRTAATSHSKLVTFTDIEGGKEYFIKVTAEVDNDNNGSRDKSIIQEFTVAALGNTVAQIGSAASLSQLYITFTNLQGFDAVSKIVITVNDPANGYSQVLTDTYMVTDEDKTNGAIEYIRGWTGVAEGNYTLTVQYRDGSNMVLGNNTATIVVQDNGVASTASSFSRRGLMTQTSNSTGNGTGTSTISSGNGGAGSDAATE